MEFEDIGRVWREEGTGELRRTRVEDLSAVLGRATRFNARARRRMGLTGKVVLVPLVLVYGYLAIRAPTPISTVGAFILAAAAVVALLRFRAVSRAVPDTTLPVRLAIQAEVARLRMLERFRGDSKWIHGLLVAGYVLYVLGVVLEVADLQVRIAALGFFAFVLGVLELAILVARRRGPSQIRALREDLESWLGGLEGFDLEDPTDGRDPDVSLRAR